MWIFNHSTLEDGVIKVNITRLPNLPYYLSPGGAIVPSQYVDGAETFEISVFTLNKRCSQSDSFQKFSLYNPSLYPDGWLGLANSKYGNPISSELRVLEYIGPATNIWSLNCTSGALTIPGFSLCLSIGHVRFSFLHFVDFRNTRLTKVLFLRYLESLALAVILRYTIQSLLLSSYRIIHLDSSHLRTHLDHR